MLRLLLFLSLSSLAGALMAQDTGGEAMREALAPTGTVNTQVGRHRLNFTQRLRQ